MTTPESIRKKSPRAPSISLDEALDRTLKVYEKERLNPAPPDVIAQGMGYKDANNGRALATIASIRYYGLVERHGDGRLGVTREVEGYKYAPSEEMRRAYLSRFVTTPPLFAELLERYAAGLPSDGNLRYELIQRGFLPSTAESLVGILRRSFDFAKIYEQESQDRPESASEADNSDAMAQVEPVIEAQKPTVAPAHRPQHTLNSLEVEELNSDYDRIPVRLPGGRRAWLVIPFVFREADKQRLKAQIDLLLTEEEGTID